MMARRLGLAACLAALLASGCVCRGPNCGGGDCGPLACGGQACGRPCLPGLGYNRIWRCNPENDCRCGPGSFDASYRRGLVGIVGAGLANSATCGQGCGEVYWGEWVSDPPDCCDPCNSCGDWQPNQCCHSGFFRRIWYGAHGYRLGGMHGDTNSCGGCNACCGGSCGGGAPYYEGGPTGGCATCGGGGGGSYHGPGLQSDEGLLHQNWEREPTPVNSRPVRDAQRPASYRSAQTAAPRVTRVLRNTETPAGQRMSAATRSMAAR